ncbi:MAG: sugar phosphate isomerase/epimerase family protein [Bryobacteraceae bacterium]
MKYGVNMFIWTADFGSSDLGLLPKVKQGGFDSFEVFISKPAKFPAAMLRQAAEQNGLGLTVCTVLNQEINIISDDAAVRRRGVAHLADCLKAVGDAGGTMLGGPVYAPIGYLPGRRRTADEWNRAVEALQELGPVAAENGVLLCAEPLNRFETYFLNTAEDAARLCDEVNHPNVRMLFDTFHANIEEKDVAASLRAAGRHIAHIHTCENDRGTPGSGHVPWGEVFAAMRDIGYNGLLTIESFGFALGEISAAASIWRDLAPTPDDIAFDGIKFLRGQAG